MTMRHVADKQLRQRTAAWPRKSPSHVGARAPSLLKRWDACEDTGQIRAAPGCSGQHLCFGYDQPQCRTPWAEKVTDACGAGACGAGTSLQTEQEAQSEGRFLFLNVSFQTTQLTGLNQTQDLLFTIEQSCDNNFAEFTPIWDFLKVNDIILPKRFKTSHPRGRNQGPED